MVSSWSCKNISCTRQEKKNKNKWSTFPDMISVDTLNAELAGYALLPEDTHWPLATIFYLLTKQACFLFPIMFINVLTFTQYKGWRVQTLLDLCISRFAVHKWNIYASYSESAHTTIYNYLKATCAGIHTQTHVICAVMWTQSSILIECIWIGTHLSQHIL